MTERPGESASRGDEPARRDRAATAPETPTWVMDRAGLAEVDRLAVREFGIPSFALMENAAAGLARHVLKLLCSLQRRDVVIVCGPGNNGGDGLAAARHLHHAGCEVRLVLPGDASSMKGDAAANLGIVRAMELETEPLTKWNPPDEERPAVIVDALFGTGLTRAVEGPYRDAILRINRLSSAGSRVVAADLPSGLDADTGLVAGGGVCVRADLTVTFAALKRGFGRLDTQRVLGEVVVVPIGCPAELLDRFGERVEPPVGHDSPSGRAALNMANGSSDTAAGRSAGDESDGPGSANQ